MIANREPLTDKLQTARRIKHLIETFYLDLQLCFISRHGKQTSLDKLTLPEFFTFVKNIPYRRDPRPVEVVARPYYIIKHRALGMDCKKKSVLCGSFLRIKNYKYRAIGSSQRPDKRVHHIFFQLFDPEKKDWRNVDATYPHNVLFDQKKVSHWEVLK